MELLQTLTRYQRYFTINSPWLLTRHATKSLKPLISHPEQSDGSDFELLKLIHRSNSKIVAHRSILLWCIHNKIFDSGFFTPSFYN
jgi:hypothetical protein